MKKQYIIILPLLVMLFLTGCKNKKQTEIARTITVSIYPIKYIADQITGNDFDINVLVPPGSSPETYEPTPRQLADMENSVLVATTGLLDFENSLFSKLDSKKNNILELHHGIRLIEGDCGHVHHHDHSHGIDPHIWISPSCLRIMSDNFHNSIKSIYPDSVRYTDNYLKLIESLDALDRETEQVITDSGVSSFLIYHPALTYYAADYGLEQISLESDGKEPSVDRMKNIISRSREEGLNYILYQKEFSRSVVETVSKDIGATPVEIDPLAEDVVANIRYITKIIAGRGSVK